MSLEKQTNDKRKTWPGYTGETNIDVYKVLTTAFPAAVLELFQVINVDSPEIRTFSLPNECCQLHYHILTS